MERSSRHDIRLSQGYSDTANTLGQSRKAPKVDHRLLLLVAPAYQRHQHQPEYVHFRFLQSLAEDIHLKSPFLLSSQPIEGHEFISQSNFWRLRGRDLDQGQDVPPI